MWVRIDPATLSLKWPPCLRCPSELESPFGLPEKRDCCAPLPAGSGGSPPNFCLHGVLLTSLLDVHFGTPQVPAYADPGRFLEWHRIYADGFPEIGETLLELAFEAVPAPGVAQEAVQGDVARGRPFPPMIR